MDSNIHFEYLAKLYVHNNINFEGNKNGKLILLKRKSIERVRSCMTDIMDSITTVRQRMGTTLMS